MMIRPSVPDPIARTLRREAGFGCCERGNPILQYHHIVPWSQEQHFRAEDVMVLCPLHHDKATKGAMDVEEQRRLKSSPHNIRRGLAKGLMEVKQDYCAANLGSLLMVGDGTALRIGDRDMLGLYLGDGNLEVSLRLYGQADELLLHIERNVWITGDGLPWDLEADWQKLTLRERARHINISIDARPRPLVVTGRFYAYGQEVSINQNGIWLERTSSGISNLAIVGGMIAVDKSSGLMSFGPRLADNVHISSRRETVR